MSETRVFVFRCEHCPTTVIVETAAPEEAQFDVEGQLIMHPYTVDDWVGGSSTDGDYVTARQCPSCGMRLVPPSEVRAL